ncbi:hypothetical protein [Embleya sp. AB8]|uniref:hypothetical protein n=1 Tax=Embleya sp. AB8 TaxID=3156304 RepID=UPI003C779014
MPERTGSERRRIDVNVVQVVGSALAAISSAFLLSTLGVAGTVIGAALASVVATVGSALYVHLFRRTGEQLREVLVQPNEGGPGPLPGTLDPRPAAAETMVLPVGGYEWIEPAATGADEVEPASDGPERVWLARSLIGAVLVFVVAMGVVTLAETAIGRSFASLFGHGGGSDSTISRIVDNKPARHETPRPPSGSTPAPDASATPEPTRSAAGGDKGTSGEPGGATPAPSTTPATRPSGTPSSDPTTSKPPTTSRPTTPPADGSGGGAGAGAANGGAAAGGSALGGADHDPRSDAAAGTDTTRR